MVMVECVTYGDFSLDGYLHSNLTIVQEEAIPNNWDCVYILFGREGTGKTTLGSQISYFLDNTFGVTKIVWTADQFDRAIDDAQEGDSILWDEAITGAMSNAHADETSMRIVKKLTMIRKKKLKIGLCFPYLYLLNKYFVGRCLFSVYIYAKGFGDRGYARFYDSRNTEKLYELMKGKYRYDYAGAFTEAKNNFSFRFTSRFCADEKEYDRLKTESSKLVEADSKEEEYKMKWIKTIRYGIENKKSFSLAGISDYLGIGKSTLSEFYYRYLKSYIRKDNIKLNIQKEENVETSIDKDTNIATDSSKEDDSSVDNSILVDEEVEQVKPKPSNISKENKEKIKKSKEIVKKVKKDKNEIYDNGIFIPDEHLDIIGERLKEDGRWLSPKE